MNRFLPAAALVLSLAALGVALFSSPETTPAVVAPPAEQGGADTASLELAERDEKIASLESTVSSLVRRVAQLEQRATLAGSAAGSAAPLADAERQQLQALRGDVDALLTGEAVETEKGRQRLKEMVRSIQDEAFAERFQERETQRAAAQAERFTRFVEEARLSATQQSDLKTLLDQEAQQRAALRERRRDGDPAAGRQGFAELRALRERTDESARALLDEEQFTKFQELRAEERRGGGRDRGGERGERRGR